MYVAIACLFDEGANEGTVTSLIRNERQNLLKDEKKLRYVTYEPFDGKINQFSRTLSSCL
jgi:hypothetical protein